MKYGSFLHFSSVVRVYGQTSIERALKYFDSNQSSVERRGERGVKKHTIWKILKIVFLPLP